MENYKTQARECLSIEVIPRKRVQKCLTISIIPKTIKKRISEYSTIITTKKESTNIPLLRYRERESPIVHIEEVSKNVGEQGQLQSLVETFIGQTTNWWDTHQSRLHTWTTTSTNFIKRFGGNMLTAQVPIPKFFQGQELAKHIDSREKEWKKARYQDE